MDVSITGKHVQVEENVKEKANELIKRLVEDFPNQKISSVRVAFAAERNWQIVEVLVNAKNISIHAAAKHDAQPAALVNAFEKINTQFTRYLQKVRTFATKADPKMKEKIWTSSDLKEDADDKDLAGMDDYAFEYNDDKK